MDLTTHIITTATEKRATSPSWVRAVASKGGIRSSKFMDKDGNVIEDQAQDPFTIGQMSHGGRVIVLVGWTSSERDRSWDCTTLERQCLVCSAEG